MGFGKQLLMVKPNCVLCQHSVAWVLTSETQMKVTDHSPKSAQK